MSVCLGKTQISLGIRPVWSVFAVRMMKPWVLSYPFSTQQRLLIRLGGCPGLSGLRWEHTHFVGFVISWLICQHQHVYLNWYSRSTHMVCSLINKLYLKQHINNNFHFLRKRNQVLLLGSPQQNRVKEIQHRFKYHNTIVCIEICISLIFSFTLYIIQTLDLEQAT